MTGIKYKDCGNSDTYKYVRKVMDEHGNYFYKTNCGVSLLFNTEREAAKKVDLILISKGKEPVNILVRK